MQPVEPVYIIFQAYGNEAVMQKCVFALLSLSRIHTADELKQVQIWIYTDKPEFFQSFKECDLPLYFKTINSNLIQQWRGDINFVHRVKIEVLIDFTKQHQGNIFYLDTDICFLQPVNNIVERISEGNLYMHVYEGKLSDKSNPIFIKLHKFFTTQKIDVNNNPITVSPDAAMWNAGVLGFKTGSISLQEVLDFTDTVYRRFPKHIVEQFAFSLHMAAHTTHIQAGAPYILHYWNLKELRTILDSFFLYFKDRTWTELVHYSQLVAPQVYMQQKANFYENRSLLDKIKKVKWAPSIPDWSRAVKEL